jgi:hypothetical protein
VGRLLALWLGALSLMVGCATSPPAGQIVAVVPGFPLTASTISVESGEQLTWVNGDPARGEIQVEFDRVPNMPDVSLKSGIYTARFDTPGTYAYTVTSVSSSGTRLVPRRGEVIVWERAPVAAPVASRPEAAPPGSTPPLASPPRPSSDIPPTTPDIPPIGADITRLKGSAQAYVAYHYQADHGIVLKLERATVKPSALRPGSSAVLAVMYTLMAPQEAGRLAVKETRTIQFGGQDLRQVEKTVKIASGTYSSEYRLTVPPDAAEGPYTVTTTVEVPSAKGIRGQVSSTFSVSPP